LLANSRPRLTKAPFTLGVHRISNPAGIPAGFNEFSGIRQDLEKIRPDLNFCFHFKKFTKNGINHQFGSFKV
jgi:hypothetical protein